MLLFLRMKIFVCAHLTKDARILPVLMAVGYNKWLKFSSCSIVIFYS
jgi:hypothetical protein